MNYNIENKFIDVNGVKIHYITAGSGQPILLIHGFPDFWYTWRHQIPILAENFKVIAPDLRGYNLSDKPEGVENYSMSSLVGDMVGLIESLEGNKVIVVGHDWGGSIAWNLAMRVPQIVSKLIVLNSPHPIPFLQTFWNLDIGQYMKSWYVLLFQLEDAPEIALKKDNFKLLKKMIKNSIFNKESFNNDDMDKYVESWSKSGSINAMINYYKANWNIAQFLKMSESEKDLLIKRFPKIKCDTLVIWGEEDMALDKSLNDGIEQYFDGNYKIEVLPYAGHWVHIDEPERVNKLISIFIKKK